VLKGAVRRYMEGERTATKLGRRNATLTRRVVCSSTGRAIWEKRFKGAAKRVQRERDKNLRRAEKSETRRLGKLLADEGASVDQLEDPSAWVGLWGLKNEHPPPSSIVSRVDTVRFCFGPTFLPDSHAYAASKGEALKLASVFERHPKGALAAWSDFMIKRTTLDMARQKRKDSHGEDGGEETAVET
jgi:hypothetical protein